MVETKKQVWISSKILENRRDIKFPTHHKQVNRNCSGHPIRRRTVQLNKPFQRLSFQVPSDGHCRGKSCVQKSMVIELFIGGWRLLTHENGATMSSLGFAATVVDLYLDYLPIPSSLHGGSSTFLDHLLKIILRIFVALLGGKLKPT